MWMTALEPVPAMGNFSFCSHSYRNKLYYLRRHLALPIKPSYKVDLRRKFILCVCCTEASSECEPYPNHGSYVSTLCSLDAADIALKMIGKGDHRRSPWIQTSWQCSECHSPPYKSAHSHLSVKHSDQTWGWQRLRKLGFPGKKTKIKTQETSILGWLSGREHRLSMRTHSVPPRYMASSGAGRQHTSIREAAMLHLMECLRSQQPRTFIHYCRSPMKTGALYFCYCKNKNKKRKHRFFFIKL